MPESQVLPSPRDEAMSIIQEIREWNRAKVMSISELTDLVNRVAHDIGSPIRFKALRLRSVSQGDVKKITQPVVELLRVTRDKVKAGTQSWRMIVRHVLDTHEIDRVEFYRFVEEFGPYPCGHLDDFPEWGAYYGPANPFCINIPGKEIAIPAVVELNNTDLRYSPFDIQIDYQEDMRYELSGELRSSTQIVFEEYISLTNSRPAPPREDEIKKLGLIDDATALRLKKIEAGQDLVKLTLQPVSYADYVRAHILVDRARSSGGENLRRYLHPDGKLPPIGASETPDLLGVDILLLTNDSYLVFTHRSSGVLTSPCTLGNSVSGTFAPEHLLGRDNLVDMITGGDWLKVGGSVHISNGELFTETHLRQHDIDDITFLGISRDLIRAGQPSMVFFATTKLSHNEVHDRYENALEKHETSALHFISADLAVPIKRLSFSDHVFHEWVDWLYRDVLADASPVLLASVGLLVTMLRREREKAAGGTKAIRGI